jgi:hypothetical protein
MITLKEIPLITVPVTHYRQNGVTAGEDVDFKIYREDNRFKAIPLMSKEERLTTGLPEELVFVYSNQCITTANNMEEESLDAIKQIVQELEAQELL